MSEYQRFECLVCPQRDGKDVLHYPLRRVKTTYSSRMVRHPHEALTNIIRSGQLAQSWWMASKRDRLRIVEREEQAAGRRLDWVRQLVLSDGGVRSAGAAYRMTNGPVLDVRGSRS